MNPGIHRYLKNLALLLVLIALLGGFWSLLKQLRENASAPVAPPATPAGEPAPQASVTPGESDSRNAAPVSGGATSETAESGKEWEAFRAKFGDHLRARFDEGRVSSIQGEARKGSRASEGFSPSNPQAAVARAKEILREAGPMLGIEPRFPLDGGLARSSNVSAQVFFRETYEGVPLSPNGSVTVSLGPEGELLGLDSDYIPSVHVENSFTLPEDQARKAAENALASIKDDSRVAAVEGGTHVIWVGTSGSAARHAYEFSGKGHQIIVDAQTGKILYRRDRRME